MMRYKLDVCGQVCPSPVLEAEALYQRLNRGDQLVIYTDHDIVGYNLMDWAEGKGLKAEMDETEPGLWQVTITR